MRSLRRLTLIQINVAEPDVHRPLTEIRYDNGGGGSLTYPTANETPVQ